jgi:hypothetical protein
MSNPGCKQNICPHELNILLVPTFLQGMSKAQICAYIEACTKKSNIFKSQVVNFFQKMKLSKQYTAERKCYCPTKVEWSVCNPPLIIQQNALCSYYNFATTGGETTGFAYILRKVLDNIRKTNLCKQYIQDGKECCNKICNTNIKKVSNCSSSGGGSGSVFF